MSENLVGTGQQAQVNVSENPESGPESTYGVKRVRLSETDDGVADPASKRVRFDGGTTETTPANSDGPAVSQPQGPQPEDYPVVEAMIRREGTDKLRRVQVDGQLNVEQRAERGLDERKKICPKSAIDQVLAGLGVAEDCEVDDDVKEALGTLAETMLEQTMQFGSLMASRRNSKWLQARDLEVYLDKAWHISLPGFGSRCVSAAPKEVLESQDFKHKAAVRTSLGALQPEQADSMTTMQDADGKQAN